MISSPTTGLLPRLATNASNLASAGALPAAVTRAEAQRAHRKTWYNREKDWHQARGDKPIPTESSTGNRSDRCDGEPEFPVH